MDERNPYAAPAASLGTSRRVNPPGYGLYLGLNLLYALLMLGCLAILLLGGRIAIEGAHLLVVGIFLAPLVSCLLVVGEYPRLFARWRWLQGLLCAVLLLFCLQDLARLALLGIGVFMTLVNLFSLLASGHFQRLRQAAHTPLGPHERM
jgi:hypothetical protein